MFTQMAKLVFSCRNEQKMEAFDKDIFFDTDNENIGKLSLVNQEFEVVLGKHTVKI